MTVALLPGARLSPEVLLHQVLQSMDGVKGVIVLKVDEDGGVDICMSSISLTELAYAAMRLNIHAQRTIDPDSAPPEGQEFRPRGPA